MQFNRKTFFDGFRDEFGKFNQQQTNGLNRLLAAIENDPHVKDVRWAAYILATSFHETAHTFHPIHEYGTRRYFINRYGGHTKKGKELGNDTQEEGYHYAGKGDVQLTGESNYERAEIALRKEYPQVVANWEAETGKTFDITVGDQPDDADDAKNVMHPEISYAIMSYGMRAGMFTGKKLSDYITASKTDYKNARRIINGTDKASLIAGYAEQFEQILKTSTAHPQSSASGNDVIKPADEPPKQEAQTEPSKPPTETTYTQEKGDTKVEIAAKNEQDVTETVTQPLPVPYNDIGFKQTIINDAKSVLPANVGLQTISEVTQQASGWPEWVGPLVTKLAMIALVVTAAWILYRVISWLVHTWRENERTKLMALINTDKNRKDIKFEDPTAVKPPVVVEGE